MHDTIALVYNVTFNYRQETRVHTNLSMTERTEHTGNLQNEQQPLMHNNACHIVNCKL